MNVAAAYIRIILPTRFKRTPENYKKIVSRLDGNFNLPGNQRRMNIFRIKIFTQTNLNERGKSSLYHFTLLVFIKAFKIGSPYGIGHFRFLNRSEWKKRVRL